MSTSNITTTHKRTARVDPLSEAKESLIQYWFFLFVGLGLLWIILPWLAPFFMKIGWGGGANAIYNFYSFQCHQMPQRSFFLFGSQTMYSLDQIQATGVDTSDIFALRQFIGNADMGYKVAWSDRMVSAYGSIPLVALLWWPFRKRIQPIPILGFFLLALPMALDAGTHFISDLSGVGLGFRYSNEWLMALTGNIFSASFYIGNVLGSFNSWMRLITGTLFGLAVVWFTFPHLLNNSIKSITSKP